MKVAAGTRRSKVRGQIHNPAPFTARGGTVPQKKRICVFPVVLDAAFRKIEVGTAVASKMNTDGAAKGIASPVSPDVVLYLSTMVFVLGGTMMTPAALVGTVIVLLPLVRLTKVRAGIMVPVTLIGPIDCEPPSGVVKLVALWMFSVAGMGHPSMSDMLQIGPPVTSSDNGSCGLAVAWSSP